MDSFFNGLSEFFASFPAWLNAILSLMAAASAIAALTPTPADDTIVGRIYKIVEWLALNVGHAKEVPPNRIGKIES